MNLFSLFPKRKQSVDNYFELITEENNGNPYSFDKRYMNQETKLLKIYGSSNTYNKKIKMIVISDTHNCLNENEFKCFMEQHKEYDVCILLGDHSSYDISKILKYIDKNKTYGLLGNHDYNYLEEYNINNLNGKIININGTTILGMQGSFKYKPSNFPSFTQRESILFLNDKSSVDILISHDNSFDNNMLKNPAHQGLFGITYYLYKNKVSYHIHGHIHNPYEKKLLNGTKEISVYMYEYLELSNETKE